MNELLKKITVKVVGVTFMNDDGTDRQEILSELSDTATLYLEYVEYKNEPAYAVVDWEDRQIGWLPKDLAADLYQNYRDCHFFVQIDDIIGGGDRNYGCVITINIYDAVPDPVKKDVTPPAETTEPSAPDNTYKALLTIFYILLAILVVLLLLGFH
jgi:hypothetical protein